MQKQPFPVKRLRTRGGGGKYFRTGGVTDLGGEFCWESLPITWHVNSRIKRIKRACSVKTIIPNVQNLQWKTEISQIESNIRLQCRSTQVLITHIRQRQRNILLYGPDRPWFLANQSNTVYTFLISFSLRLQKNTYQNLVHLTLLNHVVRRCDRFQM